MSESIENRRANPRFMSKAVIEVYSDEDTDFEWGTINNISAGGISLNLEVENLKNGFRVGHIVTFQVPVRMFGIDTDDKLKLSAEIKRTTNLGKTISCQFINLKDSEIAILNKGLRIIEVVNKINPKKSS